MNDINFFFASIIFIIWIMSLLFHIFWSSVLCHLFLLTWIISIIYFCVFIMSFISIKTDYVTYFYSNILYALCFSMPIMSIMFMTIFFFSIDIIALPLYVHLHVALCPQRPSLSLHIAGPSQCPVSWQTTSCIRLRNPAGGRRSRKVSAQAVENGSSVADWNNQQSSWDTFNWNDVENWFLVV